jgi:hypothetical protein
MTKGLSKNEQLVLYGLTKYPRLADNEICVEFDMKQSTFSTIKKKLSSERYYQTAYDPILQHLGCELLSVWYMRLNRKMTRDERQDITKNEIMKADDIITAVGESNVEIIISVSKNISEHIEMYDRMLEMYESNNFLDDINCVYFPFNNLAVFSFFDYAPLLNRIFKIEFQSETVPKVDVDSPKIRCKVESRDLSALEKRVYLGLIQHPNFSDSGLSEKIGCSRQVVRRLRNKFIDEKYLKKRRILNLKKLGFEILALTHSKFNPDKSIREREICIRTVSMFQTPIFNIARDPESVMFTAYRNFEEFQHLHERFTTFCIEHESLKEEPVNIPLSIPRMEESKWRIYEPLVKKILEI